MMIWHSHPPPPPQFPQYLARPLFQEGKSNLLQCFLYYDFRFELVAVFEVFTQNRQVYVDLCSMNYKQCMQLHVKLKKQLEMMDEVKCNLRYTSMPLWRQILIGWL